MKYLFVLGRNPELSKAEIFSYLEREGMTAKSSSTRLNGLLVEIEGDKKLDLKKVLEELGGTIAAGRVLLSGNIDALCGEIRKKPIYLGRENKVIYSLINLAPGDSSDEVQEAMKENFREERLKARYKGVGGTIKMQSGEVVRGSPTKIMLRDMNYFIFGEKVDGELSFGYLEESYDVAESEKKDMNKPYRRESLAISPRLARILINLSQVKKGETLVDPFCGIGVILGEAMLKGINVIGVDIDSDATINARRNIEWLRGNYKIDAKSEIINFDSRKAVIKSASGIATEPSLGELMTKLPQREKAQQIVANFEGLMIDVLNNLRAVMPSGSKIAFTSPLIKSQKGRVSCNIEEICGNTGLRVYNLKNSGVEFPIREFRPDQIVGRDIFVLTVK